MSDTRQLLAKISAFRARLEDVPRLVPAGDATALAEPGQLAQSVQRLAATYPSTAVATEPPKLTARAFRLLTDAKQIVDHQKKIATQPFADDDPLAAFHRGTVGLTDSALRLAQIFPPAAEAQLKMCDGFEHLLKVIRHRLGVLEHAIALRRSDESRLERLSFLLTAMHTGRAVHVNAFVDLAEVILDDARQGGRMRFLSCDPTTDGVAKFVACHSLNVCQVLARLIPHDYEWAMKPTLPVIAALMMDVGMLDVPAEVLAKADQLTDDDRRKIEGHAFRSSEIIARALPETAPLSEMVLAHHERLDGTGYPSGQRTDDIPTLPRLLAVADVYAALMAARPHRPATDPRAALTEVMLLAEQGKLDRDFAEYLLHLSFHPVGTVVELTDGRVAVVAATHNSRTNLRASMRPVVAVLTNADGEMLPRPEFVDLAAAGVGSIVRALSAAERRAKLGEWYPDLCL
jgi:HD-GYP domain-containing protein (c-di-GMP phosphodiesterase class II)